MDAAGAPSTDTDARPEILNPHGPSPPFAVLVSLYEDCLKRKLDVRRRYLTTWFGHWRKEVGLDLYPALRLILPQKDRERATYGFKEATLAKAFIASFGLNEKSPDAQSLLHWKKPGLQSKATGDFPTVLYQTIATRSSVTRGSLTVEEINSLLDQLSKGFRSVNTERKLQVETIFRTISEKCTPNEIRWIVRIILKDLSIGMKENTVLAIFHPDAMDLFNSCSDLKKISYDLADPQTRLHDDEKNVRLFKPFQPMLCGRSRSLVEAVRVMLLDPDTKVEGFVMEEKLDGERIQLHKRGNEFFYCSRKGKDYTHLYGADIHKGALTPHIASAFDPRITDAILDGEMMVWDPMLEKYLPFGTLKTSALDKDPGPDKPRPCFKIFDILYTNILGTEKVLTGETLTERVKVLKSKIPGLAEHNISFFKEIPGRFEFALQRPGKTVKDVEAFLEEVVEARGEGLVLKKHRSGYVLGGREARWWVKVKPEYMDNMGESVDVVVVGANWGTGRRGGRVSTLICAVRDDLHQSSDSVAEYRTFVRIGTGLSLEDYDWVNAKPWKRLDRAKPPAWMKMSAVGNEDKGDVYLEPEDSFVITVKAASIIRSDLYGSMYTMRFPRCRNIRRDLGVEDCLTLSDMVDMANGKRKNDAPLDQPTKKRKTVTRKGILAASTHRGADVSEVESVSKLFNGMKFYVVKDPKESKAPYTKSDIEKMIVKHGGDFGQTSIQKNGPQISVVYGGSIKTIQVQPLIKAGKKDIIKPQWVVDSITAEELKPLSKKYLFHATEHRMNASDYEDDSDDENEKAGSSQTGPSSSVNVKATGDTTEEEEDDQNDESGEPLSEWVKPSGDDISAVREVKEAESDTEEEGGDLTEEEGDVEEEEYVVLQRNVSGIEDGIKDPDDTIDDDITLDDSSIDEELDKERGVVNASSTEAREFDTDSLFSYQCFYLDTPANAATNGMQVSASSRIQAAITKDLLQIEKIIIRNGGLVVQELKHPKLTHIVLDERDLTRRIELMQQTSKPKRRHLVLRSFVEFCLEQDSLLDEDAFAP